MRIFPPRPLVLAFALLLLLVLFCATLTSPAYAAKPNATIPPGGITDTAQVFLPLAFTVPTPPTSQLGVDFGSIITQSKVISPDFALAQAMGASWSRMELPWLKIEPTPGVFDWVPYDAALARAGQLGVKVLATVHSPPTWAALESCGPISDTVAMTTFVTAAVTRYHDVVRAWEFINEPDGKQPLPNYGPTIGCWASAPAEYARQLAIFYSTVKALDPQALVLFGSLAYDNWELFDRQFLDNALANGAGLYFDVLGIHYYPINPVEFPTMRDKIQAVRSTLDKHLFSSKRIWVTETSAWTDPGGSMETQKNFIVREQTRGFCSGADTIFWFGVGQKYANLPIDRWLISLDHQPSASYFTYQHYANQVVGGVCEGRYTTTPTDIEAYHVVTAAQANLYILWSTTKTTAVTLPATNNVLVLNRDGVQQQSLTPQKGAITVQVGTQPMFVVEVAPTQ